jgi:hypothetical protein
VTALTCPTGHRFEIPRIVYGYPANEELETARRGEVILGGCMADLPVERPCPSCGLPVVVREPEGSGWGSGNQPEHA